MTSPGRRTYFLLKSKEHPVDSLRPYSQMVAVTLGFHIHHDTADEGTECTCRASQGYCNDSSIDLEFATTAAPHQIGASERDGHTLATIARFPLKGGNVPLGQIVLRSSLHLQNIAARCTTRRNTILQDVCHRSSLRAIGVREFIHVEVHATKTGDNAWGGEGCTFKPNSRPCRIHNAEKGTIVESHKVTLLEHSRVVRKLKKTRGTMSS